MPTKQYYFDLAKQVSTASKDRSRHVGAVIVGPDGEIRSTGYNGFPRGINDSVDARHARPAKYSWTEHSERNAIYQAARVGIPLANCSIYTWAEGSDLGVCVECARAIIQAGIKHIYVQPPDNQLGKNANQVVSYTESIAIALEMLKEAKVSVEYLS